MSTLNGLNNMAQERKQWARGCSNKKNTKRRNCGKCGQYKNKTTKLLPIVANLAHGIEIFKLLKGNFIMIEQE
jgi:hypothetical protein